MRECTPDNHLRVVNLPPDPAVAQINRWSASSTYAEGTLKKQISRRQASAHNHAAAYSQPDSLPSTGAYLRKAPKMA